MRKWIVLVGGVLTVGATVGFVSLLVRSATPPVWDAVHAVDGELTAMVSATGVVGSDDTVDIKYPVLARVERSSCAKGIACVPARS